MLAWNCCTGAVILGGWTGLLHVNMPGLPMIKEEPGVHCEVAAVPHLDVRPVTVNNVSLTLGPTGHLHQSSGNPSSLESSRAAQSSSGPGYPAYPPPAVKFTHMRTPEGVLTSYPIMVNGGGPVQELVAPPMVAQPPAMVTQPPAMVAHTPMA